LHPELALISYNATNFSQNIILLSNTEYYSGQETSPPFFSFDGNDLYFVGCNIDCFVNVNGQKFDCSTWLNLSIPYAKKTGSPTIAYATGTTIVVRYLDRELLLTGRIIDSIVQPVYNWRTNRYETLGNINNRLYMMAFDM